MDEKTMHCLMGVATVFSALLVKHGVVDFDELSEAFLDRAKAHIGFDDDEYSYRFLCELSDAVKEATKTGKPKLDLITGGKVDV